MSFYVFKISHEYLFTNHIEMSMRDCFMLTESVQQSLEKMFGKAGGRIPVTPSEAFEKRMGVSCDNVITYLLKTHLSGLNP